MRSVKYKALYKLPEGFKLAYNEENQIVSIENSADPFHMNWARGRIIWGTVISNLPLSAVVTRSITERNTLLETYVFRNETEFDIYALGTGLGVCLPFPDYYTDAATCLTMCCNTHIWCGGAGSYIMALRMGGAAPNLGLVVRCGGLQGYSVERSSSFEGKEEELSNHRGAFILHPDNLHLRPGEEYRLSWELFWFQDKEEFKQRLLTTPDYIHIEAKSYLLSGRKPIRFSVNICSGNGKEAPVVMRGGNRIPCIWQNGQGEVCEVPEHTGEYHYEIIWKGRKAKAVFLVMSELDKLAEKRCRFIASRQQCRDEKSHLDGAYLIYDNEEQSQYYEHLNDHNGGRERVGMGILMTFWLRRHPDKELEKSLNHYLTYVLRELYDEETGEVFNDAPRCRDYIRLYNYPWVSRFFLEMYQLKKEEVFLDRYYKSVEYFYQEGGRTFYAIGIPMYESVQIFRQAGRREQAERLLAYYKEQGEFILFRGRDYPAHEVDYEQSIVAPAAIYMCELYLLTEEARYLKAAKEQLEVLELFQGFQPDYHMNEVAIRHWDGYWFGKRRCLGDTYPHYWSALSGYAYRMAGEMLYKARQKCIERQKSMEADAGRYMEKAENTLRAVLSLFREDGSASCAMVYPMSVNGRAAAFYDPWANDQDWGMYFCLKYGDCYGEREA